MRTGVLLLILGAAVSVGCAVKSADTVDIIVPKHLSDEKQQIIASYIWKSLRADIRIGIASVGDETAFSFDFDGSCSGVVTRLPALKLQKSDEAGCGWNSSVSLEDIEKLR